MPDREEADSSRAQKKKKKIFRSAAGRTAFDQAYLSTVRCRNGSQGRCLFMVFIEMPRLFFFLQVCHMITSVPQSNAVPRRLCGARKACVGSEKCKPRSEYKHKPDRNNKGSVWGNHAFSVAFRAPRRHAREYASVSRAR